MMKGFTAQHWKKKLALMPVEEVFKFNVKKKVMAVADGVTRDPTLHLPNKKTLMGQIKFALPYPRVRNHTRATARIFCNFSVNALRDFVNIDEKAIRESIAFANKGIRQYAEENVPCVDYLKNDFPGCVAALTAETRDGTLCLGYICDTGIAVVKENGNLAFKTENDGPEKHDKDIWPLLREKFGANAKWHMPEVRAYEREHFRNRPEAPSFGVLTGEESAMHYVRTDVIELLPSDLVLVYTDGLEHIIFGKDKNVNGNFADLVKTKDWKGIERMCKQQVKTEGTLVYSNSSNQKNFEFGRDFNEPPRFPNLGVPDEDDLEKDKIF